MVRLVQVAARDVAAFRAMAEAYWRELMPRADVVRDQARRATYFQERFAWDGGPGHPRWAVADGRRIDFVMFNVSDDRRVAHVHDFYVVPPARRRGHGGAMARELLAQLDRLGVRQVDLNVRADNPRALAFGQAQVRPRAVPPATGPPPRGARGATVAARRTGRGAPIPAGGGVLARPTRPWRRAGWRARHPGQSRGVGYQRRGRTRDGRGGRPRRRQLRRNVVGG